MPEYSKMKNADLETLLKGRGLPTGGKKADMVERLTADDENQKTADTPAATAIDAPAKPIVQHPEDEIDWDDDEEVPVVSAAPESVATTTTTKTTDAATTIANAGGEGAVNNPQAVPNQVADIVPSKTDDLTVVPPTEDKAVGEEKAVSEEKKEPAPDYSRGLAASNLEQEIEKRKARAKKFGLNIEEDEGLKKLERARKFGEAGPPAGLDEALPERSRKRGREDADEGKGGDKRRGGRFGGRRGRGNGDKRRNDDRDNRDTRGPRDNKDNRRNDKRSNGGTSWMSDADRARAEARKTKFAKSTS